MANEFAKQIPLRRVAAVHELSDVITFLATPSAGYINGAIIHVDGGRTASKRTETILGHHSGQRRTRSHSDARSRSRSPATRQGRRAAGREEIAALIDTGEPRLDTISERGLRTSYHRISLGVAASEPAPWPRPTPRYSPPSTQCGERLG